MASFPVAPKTLGTQIRYQLTLLMRTPRAMVTGLVLPAGLFALELGHWQHNPNPAANLAVIGPRLAGLLLFGAAAIAYFTHANGLVMAREAGVLRRWRASPLPAWAYFAGRVVATLAVVEVAGAVLLVVGTEMGGLHLTATAIGGLLLTQTLSGLALAAAGTAVTRLITSAQAAQPMLMLTYIPLLVFSGGFGPATEFPHWLTTVMSYLPAQPAVDAAYRALAGLSASPRDLAVLACWIVGGLLLAVRFFQWDPHRPSHARKGNDGAISGNQPYVQTNRM